MLTLLDCRQLQLIDDSLLQIMSCSKLHHVERLRFNVTSLCQWKEVSLSTWCNFELLFTGINLSHWILAFNTLLQFTYRDSIVLIFFRSNWYRWLTSEDCPIETHISIFFDSLNWFELWLLVVWIDWIDQFWHYGLRWIHLIWSQMTVIWIDLNCKNGELSHLWQRLTIIGEGIG